jgi:hypothetical protein
MGQVAELIDSVILANGPLFAAQTTRIVFYNGFNQDEKKILAYMQSLL